MASPDSVTGPINLGSTTECSILELATLILDLTGSRSRILYQPLPQDDPGRRQPDISKASTVLGWKPVVSLRTGLASTIEYFEGLLREPHIKDLVRGNISD